MGMHEGDVNAQLKSRAWHVSTLVYLSTTFVLFLTSAPFKPPLQLPSQSWSMPRYSVPTTFQALRVRHDQAENTNTEETHVTHRWHTMLRAGKRQKSTTRLGRLCIPGTVSSARARVRVNSA